MRVAKLLLKPLILLAAVVAGSVATSLLATDVRTVGLFLNDTAAYDGYTLFAPNDGNTYLINNDGQAVHTWDSSGWNGVTPYLLDDGSIIQVTAFPNEGIQRRAWDGTVLWSYRIAGAHHDIEVLPNGNILMIVNEFKTAAEATQAGRDPASLNPARSFPLMIEKIIEVEPVGASGGNIVWEWNVWDHLIQDFDASKDNFGSVADHPELVDVNFGDPPFFAFNDADWLHANGIDYNPEFDQIMVSVRQFNEFWVIDHSTSTETAASHSGGNSGKGGDLLYRWGDPQAYDAGDESDKMLFAQHDAQWIVPGLPGAGNILVFNNGVRRPSGKYSSVDELVPPVDAFGDYSLSPGEAYGPADLAWSYSSPSDFYSSILSGASRLPNGNTLIDAGVQGTFFEVTVEGETVWKYVNPVTAAGPLRQGEPPPVAIAPPNPNAVFRIYRYPLDYPAFEGRDLTPQGLLELPKPTPVITATSTATPTAPATATPTSTPVPAGVLGDADGDGSVTAIDAALLLQFTAGLLAELPDPVRADMNGDGLLNAIDAALILQTTAGLFAATPA